MSDEVLDGPAYGARLVIKLDPASGEEGGYALSVTTAAGAWHGSATVRAEDGEVVFGAWENGEPGPWLVTALHALLRLGWQRKRAGEPWPRRLARWRPAPAGSEGA